MSLNMSTITNGNTPTAPSPSETHNIYSETYQITQIFECVSKFLEDVSFSTTREGGIQNRIGYW